ncbi:polysaccharide deacetylase family protein [Natronorubrum daqingense]|uniref:Polysaccharide deacetylase n=1 Tax=Natronorubrum daqingense TaxID=588898 RepID=A0A1N6XXD0_9EURY|nr:polysaccharide deacetylase family protein [Natronorubrum daqingense]APX95840.1 polysaccharide deacetylase [Natronorubrum daqingense]SIR06893.1 Polysaccharide deacetylase [Natronorubrum daqingense]
MNRRTYLTTGLALGATGFAGVGLGQTEGVDEEDVIGEDPDDDDEFADAGPASPPPTGTFDDFETLERWRVRQDIGSFDVDTDRYYEGSQSVVFEADDEGQTRIRRTLNDPIDIRTVAPGLAVASERGSVVRIQLQDADGDYVEYSQRVLDGMPLTRKNFGLTRIRGDPDLSEIFVLQIVHWGDEDADGVQLWVDDFHFVPKPETGRVMLQFHGGYESHYTVALSLLEEYGVTGSAFVPPERIGTESGNGENRLTEGQIASLAGADWTIGSYAARGSHLDGGSSSELAAEIVGPTEWLEDGGYADDGRFFAYPGAVYSEASYELVAEHYDLGFAGSARAQGYAGNPYLCSLTSSPEPFEAADVVEWTAEHGGITAIPFYEIDDEDSYEALEETVSRIAELEAAGHLETISPVEMAEEYVY